MIIVTDGVRGLGRICLERCKRSRIDARHNEATMKKTLLVLLLVVGVLALTVTPGYTWGHWRGGVFVGVGPYWGPYPYYYYPPPPPYYYSPPTVVIEQPPVYVEQPAPPPAPQAPTAFWYYCSSAKGYYPTVASCPEEWVKVPERPR
jgi:hypothetical protein